MPSLASRFVLACFIILAACYAPDLGSVHYTCDAANPFCPDGQQCINGCCGGPPCKAPPSGGPDGSTTGGKICASDEPVAMPNTADVVGCMGKFAEGQLATLCGSDFELCETNPMSDSVCATIPDHFFASKQIACQLSTGTTPRTGFRCDWTCDTSQSSRRYVLGCGKSDGGPVVLTYAVDPPLPRCGGFNRATACDNGQFPASQWQCMPSSPPTDADLSKLVNGDAQDGALCCRKKAK